ncbi:hypothetical protein Hanom_Chr01g00040391 [Helianthus anomalus]
MGGPSHAVPENDPPPVTFAPPPPPMGYKNPISTYPRSSGYNPFDYQAPTGYEYQAPSQDPYLEAAQFNTLYPSPFPPAYPTGNPVQGFQYPPYQQQPPPPQLQMQQILQRLDHVEQKAEERDKKHNKFLKGLANFIKGKKK